MTGELTRRQVDALVDEIHRVARVLDDAATQLYPAARVEPVALLGAGDPAPVDAEARGRE